jgi:predicted Zn-dependent protease
VAVWAAALALWGCDRNDNLGGGGRQPSPAELYQTQIDQLVVEVDYAVGAEPYVMGRPINVDPWSIFQANVAGLFSGTGKVLSIPSRLEQMEAISTLHDGEYTTESILAIAQAHRGQKNSATVATFYVLFLPGYYNDGTQLRTNVLGVSLANTGVIAMFKPVIESSAATNDTVRVFVEQSTLVHEFGHAVGLVNNGIAATSPHHDSTHGAHCTNRDCVMHYLNEGTRDLMTFIQRANMTQSLVLYGQECLDDAQSMIPR